MGVEMDKEKPELMPMHYERKKKILEEEKEKLEREVAYYLKRRKSNRTEIISRALFLVIALYFVKGFLTGDIALFLGDAETGLLFAVIFLLLFVIPLTVLTVRSARTYNSEEKLRKEYERQIEDLEDEIDNLTLKMMIHSSKGEDSES